MQRRYWAGKAPEWATADDDPSEKAPPSVAAAPAVVPAADVQTDARLARLTQRLAQPGHADRGASEAVVVRRRPVRSPRHDDASAAPQHLASPDAGGRSVDVEDEEAIAARRLAIRARQLTAGETAAHGSQLADVRGAACHAPSTTPATLRPREAGGVCRSGWGVR